MGVKLCLVLLLLAVAVVPHSSTYTDGVKGWNRFHSDSAMFGFGSDVLGEDRQKVLTTEASRRHLYGENKYLSYDALRRNAIPCGRRGHSYYNCNRRQRINPYRRGCSAITRCARFTD